MSVCLSMCLLLISSSILIKHYLIHTFGHFLLFAHVNYLQPSQRICPRCKFPPSAYFTAPGWDPLRGVFTFLPLTTLSLCVFACFCVQGTLNCRREILGEVWGSLFISGFPLSPPTDTSVYRSQAAAPDTGARFRSAHYPPLQGSTRL